jgi:hydroxypyruvate isomerase
MIKLAANLDWLWKDLPLDNRLQAASKAGFRHLESLNPYVEDINVWADLLTKNKLELVLVNAPSGSSNDQKVRGLAAWPSKHEEFRFCFSVALEYAKALHVPLVHATAGPILPGTNWQSQQDSYIQNLQWACKQAESSGITVTIEPLSPRDAPGSFMASLPHALQTMKEVNSKHLKLQFDLYHQQILHGDIITKLREHFHSIGHIQIAGVPDRTEPNLGELSTERVLHELRNLGYQGFIGCEYRPSGPTPEEGLGWAKAYL